MSKPTGSCVFCGHRGQLSKEDVWPRWIRRATADVTIGPSTQLLTRTTIAETQMRPIQKNGPTTSAKVRKVCERNCNNGWMSRLENAAKLLLLPMIRGLEADLDLEHQQIVSRWAVKTATMMQLTDAESKTTTPQEDREFYASKRPLEGTEVWLARHVGQQWFRRFVHSGPVVAQTVDEPLSQIGLTVFVIDHLAVLVMIRRQIKGLGLHGLENKTVRCWPPSSQVVSWPAAEALTDADLQTLTYGYGWLPRSEAGF